MRRVLIVTECFLPHMNAGIQRNAGYAKYLPKFGWAPFVLTRAPEEDLVIDRSAGTSEIIPPRRVMRTRFLDIRRACRRLFLKVTRTKVPLIGQEATGPGLKEGPVGSVLWRFARRYIFIPDRQIGWFPFAVGAGVAAIRAEHIDAIISSSPPSTAHLIGLALKRITGRPWIADFRDAWTQNPYAELSGKGAFGKAIDRFLERRVMRRADVIVSVSRPIVEAFTQLKVRGIRPKVRVITNGFDPDDFAGREHRSPAKFTMTYTGTFIGKDRSPTPVLKALRELLDSGQIRRDSISLRILEMWPQDTASVARAYGLWDLVSITAGSSHRETVRAQIDASVLLLIIRNDHRGVGEYTGKLFEYLGARRPILALVPPEGVAAELIREAKAGTVVDSRKPEDVKQAILRYYEEHVRTGTVKYSGDEVVISRYERPALAGQLARLLDVTTQAGRGSERGRVAE